MDDLRTLDVTDDPTFALVPPCADPGFDHRSCDYWEDDARGSKAARLDWLEPSAPTAAADAPAPVRPGNPFLDDLGGGAAGEPVRPRPARAAANPFLDADDAARRRTRSRRRPRPDRPSRRRAAQAAPARPRPGRRRQLRQGPASTASATVAYCQFGPLTAYPRAQRIRDLYPRLPVSPLPAVITCISTIAEARGEGHGLRLVAGRLRGPRRRAGSPRSRRTRSSGRARTPRAARRRRSGRRPGSSAPSTTRGSRSCGASWREASAAAVRAAVAGRASSVVRGRGCARPGRVGHARPRRPRRAARRRPARRPAPPDPSSPTGRRSSSTKRLLDVLPAPGRRHRPRQRPRHGRQHRVRPGPGDDRVGASRSPSPSSPAHRSATTSPSSASSSSGPAPSTTPGSGRWRDTYDAAACEPAGGVAGQRRGRDRRPRHVHRHVRPGRVHLPRPPRGPDRLVSITSVGRAAARRAGRGRPRRVGFGHGWTGRDRARTEARPGARAAPS